MQDRLSAAEHWSDTKGVQEENGALGSHRGSLRSGGLGSTFASQKTKHDLVEGKVLTHYKRERRRSAMVSGKIPGPSGCSIPGPPGACVHLGNPNAQTLEQTLMCSSSK